MNSSFVPAGPEVAPTQQLLQPLSSPTNTHRLVSWNSTGFSPALVASITLFLPLFALAILVVAIRWIQRRRITLDATDEPEMDAGGDVEALAATRLIVPVTPRPDVRWTPQIRSISGPVVGKSSHRTLALPPKRARSPPPFKGLKPPKLLLDSCPESTPAHSPLLPHQEILHSAVMIPMSPAVTPQALAVSGMQARSLGERGRANGDSRESIPGS